MRDEAIKAVTSIGLALQEQIDHGLLPPASKLPAERKLSELFGTTRITVREALLQLEAQGQIYREERRGWFVSPPRLAYNLMQRSHFHAMVSDQGRVASTEVISARLQPASAIQDHPFRHLVMFQSLDDQVVPNVVEERADIHFQYPVLTTAPNGTLTQSIVGRSSGPVPIRVRMENRIDHSLHISFHRALGYPIRNRWDAKDALLAVVFRNALFPHRWREIRP